MTRITQQALESYLWGAAVLLRGTIDAGDYKQFIFPLLFFKRLCDVYDEETVTALRDSGGDQYFAMFPENHRFQITADSHWREVRKVNRDVGHTLQQAMRAIEVANQDKLMGIFGDAQWTNKDRLSDAMLRDLIEHLSTMELTVTNLPEDELGQGYEYLIKKFADDSGHTAAEFYTNRTVVHLMTEMLDVQPGESVYDPTCGSGGMLLSCITHLRRAGKEWRNVKLYGQELNLMTSSIARMNCFLHGIEDFRIERGDTLAEPKLVEGDRLQLFDVVLANPPYSIKQWNREAFAADPWGRNVFGTPPPGRADYAFWQHILQSLKPKTGRCAILFPHGILFRKEEAEMRSKIIEADAIECILGLGPNLFYNSPMEACVVICRTDKPKSRKGKVLLINAINEVTRERSQSFLTDEHIAHICKAYESFTDEPGFSYVVTREELRSNQGNLSIPLYIAAAATGTKQEVKPEGSLVESMNDWRDSSANVALSLAQFLPAMAAPERQYKMNPNWAELPLFDHLNWKRVRFGDVVTQMKVQVDPEADSIERYVAGEHMETENVHIRKWGMVGDGYLGPAFIRGFRKGQVLYGSRRTYLKKVAVAEWDGVTSNTTFVIEAVEGKMLQELLPWLMLSERFTKHSVRESKGSTNPYINFPDIAKFEFDLPPLDQQRRIAEILWAVDAEGREWLKTKSAAEQALDTFVEHSLAEFEGKTRRVRLGDMIQEGRPLCYGIVQPGEVSSDGTPFIRVCDMEGGNVNVAGLMRVSESVNRQYRRSTVANGDILVSIVGTIGRVAIVGPECEGFNIARAVARIAPSPDLRSDFLAFLLRATSTQRRLVGSSFESARKTLNLSALAELEFPLPIKKQQSAFMEELTVLHEALAALTAKREASNKLQMTIANQLFS
jgi:type I restriction enzyme M protein